MKFSLYSVLQWVVGTNLVFQNQLYSDLIESWLYLALYHMVRTQWQKQDPAALKELTV